MAVHGILGKKIGMTQIFLSDGAAVPVTVVQAGPCLVVQRKSPQKDGYEAVQIGLVESRPDRRASQPQRGRFEKAGVAPMRTLSQLSMNPTGTSSVQPVIMPLVLPQSKGSIGQRSRRVTLALPQRL